MSGVYQLNPFGKMKCYMMNVNFNTCLLCQLFWIRGLLYRIILAIRYHNKKFADKAGVPWDSFLKAIELLKKSDPAKVML